jgi:hypothetical protein
LILHTIIPLEVVLDGSDSYQPVYSEIPWKGGGTLLVEDCGQNSVKVVRLLSTNPSDYLDPAVQPGSILGYEGKMQLKK